MVLRFVLFRLYSTFMRLGHQLGAGSDREHGDRDVDYLQGADLGRNRDGTHFSDIGQRGRCEPHGSVRLWSAFLLEMK